MYTRAHEAGWNGATKHLVSTIVTALQSITNLIVNYKLDE